MSFCKSVTIGDDGDNGDVGDDGDDGDVSDDGDDGDVSDVPLQTETPACTMKKNIQKEIAWKNSTSHHFHQRTPSSTE